MKALVIPTLFKLHRSWSWPVIYTILALLATMPSRGATVLRTIGYHQLTAFTGGGVVAADHALAISADGSRMTFARVDSRAYGAPTNLIYTVKFDGTGLNLIDAYPGDSPQVDISADGSKVLSWHGQGQPIRMVNADGSNPHKVIFLAGGYSNVRLSADGTKVFFFVDRDFPTAPDTGTHPAGLYVVNSDGTGLHALAGASSVATTFGVTPADVSFVAYGIYLGLSGDGSRLLFKAAVTNSMHLLGVNADGTGLHELPLVATPINWIYNYGLNGDGTKAFYYISYGPCCSSGEELGVMNWDGSGQLVMLGNHSTNQSGSGYGVNTDTIQLSTDGSKLLFGDTSYLFKTDGSGRLELGWSARFAANNLLQWGFYRGVMSSNANRFAYLTPAGANGSLLQVASAELNPASLGLAPAITGVSVTPAYITTNGASPVFAFRPSPTSGLVPGGGVQAGILLNGIGDPALWQGSSLSDNGTHGDAVAGDGTFSDNSAYYNTPPAIGPRTLRYKAELLGTDGNYHATAIDLAPFFVVGQAPVNAAPTVSTITPASASPGSLITIDGSGFDPIAGNNYILFGNVPAQVLSVNPAGTQLLVVVPSGLPFGPVAVTVSSTGQTSVLAGFGLTDPNAGTLVLKLLAGLDIYGTVGMTYRIDYLSDVANTNSWVPVTNLTLSSSPYFWVDVSSTNQTKRYYRSVRVP